MFSKAQKMIKIENLPKSTPEQINHYRKIYQLMGGIPGLQDISGKIFYINLKLIFK